MDFAEAQRQPGKHPVGLIVVAVMHLILGYALVNGLGKRIVEVIKGPIETKIIEEVKPPPPPPPDNLPPPPKNLPPPPSFVPPPEVNVAPQPTNAPTITTTTVAPPPAPVNLSPAPPTAAPAPAAPPAPVARTAPKINFNAGNKPEYTAAAARAEIQCTVVVAYTMETNGSIDDAHIERSCGPSREHKQLDRATLEAVRAVKGIPGTVDGKPEKLNGRVEYVWKLD